MFQLSPLSSGTDISPPCKLPGTLIQLVLLPDLSENTVTMVKAAVMMTKMRRGPRQDALRFLGFFFFHQKLCGRADTITPGSDEETETGLGCRCEYGTAKTFTKRHAIECFKKQGPPY